MKLAVKITLVMFCTLTTALSAQESDRPNVLLILVDDLRPLVGAYGEPVVQTPNIDELAASGFLFENAFALVPVCGASRAALFSGRKPTTNRFVFFNARLDEDLPDAPSLPEHFRQHGYHTLANGKVFDNMMDSADSWSEPVWSPSGDWTSPVPADERGEADERGDESQKAYLDNPDGVIGPAFERLYVIDSDYPDGKIAEKTVQDLGRLRELEAPFFLAVGFLKPHLPFNAPERYWNLYDPDNFKLPITYSQSLDGAPLNLFYMAELRQFSGIPTEGPLEEAQALNLIHAYHASVSYADAQIGKVLDALEREGLADDTIVVLLGDHGFNLGEHTLWAKHNLSEMALRSPMIVRDPKRASGHIRGVIDFLDIFPALVELADLPAPGLLDGVSFVPALNDTTVNVKQASISRWFDGTSVRTSRFRYTEWRSEAGEITVRTLFDLSSDPEETRNVADEPAFAKVVDELNLIIDDDDSNSPWSPLVRQIVTSRK